MQNMLAPNSNVNHSNLVEHAHMKLFDGFVNMTWEEDGLEQINSLWYSLMVLQMSQRKQQVKQGLFKIQACFANDFIMKS